MLNLGAICDARRVTCDPMNRYTNTIFICNDLTSSELGEHKIHSLYMEALQKISEKHYIMSSKQLTKY